MQTTLLGLAIAFIMALIAALIGPYFIDWNRFRPQFEAEATRVIGASVRVGGRLDARLLPTPSLQLHSVAVGGPNDRGKVRADKLDVEFSLGSLMRGEWRANELTVSGLSLDLGLDTKGRIDWPASSGTFNLGSLSIDRLNLTGRVALHDAASHKTLELNDIGFSGDVRSLAGAVHGDGNFMLAGERYPFRVSSGQSSDGNGTRVHLTIDPGERALSADLDGVLSFEARAPHFDGVLALATPPRAKSESREAAPLTWRMAAKVKADPAAARLDQIDVSYGGGESALKLQGTGDIRFGGSPLLHVALSARQLDADRFAGDAKDTNSPPPTLLWPGLRMLIAAIPQFPIPLHVEFGTEQIMAGGRPVQDLAADLHAAAGALTIDRLDFRAPGNTRVSFSGGSAPVAGTGGFKGVLDVDSSDPDTLFAWVQGRGEVAYRAQKPLRLRGDVSMTSERVAIDGMKAEIDGGTVEGRLAVASLPARTGSRVDAELKAERLDLDTASSFLRSLAGAPADWPEEALLSLDIGLATAAGQELRPFTAKFGYGPALVTLDQLKIGEPGGVGLQAAGKFERGDATGKLTLSASAASLGQIAGLVAPLAPTLASRLNAMTTGPGPARLNLALALDKNAAHADRGSVRATFDLDTAQIKGAATITVEPAVAALRGMDVDALRQSEFSFDSRLSAEHVGSLLTLLGLGRVIAAGEGPAQFEASAAGKWGAPLRLKVRMAGTGLDAEAQGTAEPWIGGAWASEPAATFNLKVGSADLAPLFDLQPSGTRARSLTLSSRASLRSNRLSLDDLDGTISGSRLRGHLALTLDDDKAVDGEVGLDTIDLAPVVAFALGAAGHDAAEPLKRGVLKGWHGRIAFQALRGGLPGGAELRPVGGILRNDGQSLTFDSIKGGIGGGEAVATIDAKPTADGIALSARVQLSGADGAVLRYRALAMPAGRAAMQMTLATQGRSAAALTGALSGSGIVMLESARIAGLNPRAFDAAIKASDNGQATDDVRLREIVEPVLSSGSLSVASAQIPFTIRDGRIRVGTTAIDGEGARAIVSGGYDIGADQADIRASLASPSAGAATARPEIQLFAAGSPDALDRNVDVAALSSWLAVRAIDRETRRLDSIERGEPPPIPASIPQAVTPNTQPPAEAPPAVEPLRPLPRPRMPAAPRPAASSSPGAPVVSQQVAPLPPPIDVRPAPGSVRLAPKPKPPLVLTPPAAKPPPAF